MHRGSIRSMVCVQVTWFIRILAKSSHPDPISVYHDATPGFLPTSIGLVILNALPGIWKPVDIGSLAFFVWQPLFNLAYPAASSSATTGCVAHVTETIISTTISSPVVTTTCSGNLYPQACAHYSSVASVYGPKTLICPTSPPQGVRPVTAIWNKQHDPSWRYWIPTFYKPKRPSVLDVCNRDEYPPFAFNGAGQPQYVRFLSEYENKGAGQLWRAFCKYPPPSSSNIALTGITSQTCYYTRGITYTVKALTIVPVSLSAWNAYGVLTNPCYPHTLTSDGGYALLTYDSWYNQFPSYAGGSSSYQTDLASFSSLTTSKTRPRSSPAKRWLDDADSLLDHPKGLMVDDGNVTRPATKEELWERYRIMKCETPDCIEELKTFGLSPGDVLDPHSATQQEYSRNMQSGRVDTKTTAAFSRVETPLPGHTVPRYTEVPTVKCTAHPRQPCS